MEHSTRLDHLPEGLTFPPNVADRVRHDAEAACLIFDGFMSKAEYDRLYLLSDDWAYRRALEELFRASTEEARPPGPLRRLLASLGALRH